MGLSATINKKVLGEVLQGLQLVEDEVTLISLPPDRPNIFLDIIHQRSYDMESDLQWLVKDITEQQHLFPKTVIFCPTIAQVSDIFEYLVSRLGMKAFYEEQPGAENRLVSMYHGQVSEELQTFTIDNFRQPDTKLRVLISTVAFGMGVEIPDITNIVHWGRSKSVLGFWQEIGRCGRDGRKSRAVFYPKTVAGLVDSDVFLRLRQGKECARKIVLEYFELPGMNMQYVKALGHFNPCEKKCDSCECQLCVCCSYCRRVCSCV